MLQSLQGAVIYGLLCSQCPDIVSDADAAWLVSITEVRFLLGVTS